MDKALSILFLDMKVDDKNVCKEAVIHLVNAIRPSWKEHEIRFEKFPGGNVNIMACCYHEQDDKKNDAMIVRVFLPGLGEASNRDKEFMALQIAHKVGCFPAIYAIFNNGLVHKYAKGRTLEYQDLVDPGIIHTVTRTLYRLNHVDVNSLMLLNRKGEPSKFDTTIDAIHRMKVFIDNIPGDAVDPVRQPLFRELRKELTNDVLLKEYGFVCDVLDDVQLPVYFCHGDLHPHNIILDEETGEIAILDYEMTGYSQGQFDLSYLYIMWSFSETLKYNPEDLDREKYTFTDELYSKYVQGYLDAKYESEGRTKDEVPECARQLAEAEQRISDMATFAYFLSVFAWVNVEKKDPVLFVPVAKEKYLTLKNDIENLKRSYQELKQGMDKPLCDWY